LLKKVRNYNIFLFTRESHRKTSHFIKPQQVFWFSNTLKGHHRFFRLQKTAGKHGVPGLPGEEDRGRAGEHEN
jgi:hypothetical protein